MPMTNHSTVTPARRLPALLRCGALGIAALAACPASWAQPSAFPVLASQRATAQKVAQAGVPLSELAPDAPDSHTVKAGDTLWDISGLFLKQPWRWPELWGMNLQQIRNPHLIYPGQVLVLHKADGRAVLKLAGGEGSVPTVRLSPHVRSESLSESAIPPIPLREIQPFLTEAVVSDEATLARAPRIVAAPENRVMLSQGDRAYARGQLGENGGQGGQPLTLDRGQPREFRLFRNAKPLKDPGTGEVLGYEAQYVGKAELVRGESVQQEPDSAGQVQRRIVPATVTITSAREEVRVGDRMLPEPAREVPVFVPRVPESAQNGRIVSVYGNAVRFASQNQVVAINRGQRDGLERGHVLAVYRHNAVLTDKTDESRPDIQLPGERNGLMIVFRTFERVSYALVLQVADGVKVGDRFMNP
jgi:LysM domain